MILDKEGVLRFLPHRDPFLFIDKVLSVDIPDKTLDDIPKDNQIKHIVNSHVLCEYTTDPNHPIFAGHFPNYPILPGVVQIEMMAQATSFATLLCFEDPFNSELDCTLVSVTNAKFRKPILPNMRLEIKTVCNKLRAPMMFCDCEVYHEGEKMSEATVLASLRIKDQE